MVWEVALGLAWALRVLAGSAAARVFLLMRLTGMRPGEVLRIMPEGLTAVEHNRVSPGVAAIGLGVRVRLRAQRHHASAGVARCTGRRRRRAALLAPDIPGVPRRGGDCRSFQAGGIAPKSRAAAAQAAAAG